jgi:hypothetical protein
MDPLPPLVKYGADLDGPGDDPATVTARAERHDNIQNVIAACMAAQGFRYTPVPAQPDVIATRSRISTGLRYLPVPNLPADRATVVRVGYGVMASSDVQTAAEGSSDDPNVAYQSSLGPAEADAYGRALQGDWNNPAAGQGCSGKALAQYPELATSDRQQAFTTEFGALVDAARVDVPGDPRTLQLDAEWESCMSQHGYVLQKLEGEHGPRLAMGMAVRTRPDGTVGPVHYGETPTSEIPVEEKSLLGTEPERKVAVADYDCRVETNYMKRLTDIRWSLDEDFIRRHQADLDRLAAAAESW